MPREVKVSVESVEKRYIYETVIFDQGTRHWF